VAANPNPPTHGQSEKEASTEDEQAQAPKALEGESPQEAHVAKVSGSDRSACFCQTSKTRRIRGGFSFFCPDQSAHRTAGMSRPRGFSGSATAARRGVKMPCAPRGFLKEV
jgi:hypothetical protein